jgi:drug/metabolite transporter (DMT)-like permease
MSKTHDHTAMPKGRDIPILLLGIIGIGTSGPLIAKSIMPVPTLIFWRNLAGSLIMAPFALRKREWSTPEQRRAIAIAALSGVFLALHFIGFFIAMRFTSVAAGTALTALQPIFSAIYVRSQGGHIAKLSLFGMAVAFASVLVITGVDFNLSMRAFEGDLFAIACAALAATYVMFGSKVQATISTSTYTTVCYGVCALTALPMIFITSSTVVAFPKVQWLWLFLLVIGAQILGHTMFNLALKRLSPVVVSLIVFFEVPVAAIFALIWLHQKPSAGILPGIVGILIGCSIFVLGRNSK